MKCSVCEFCRKLAQICKSGNRKEQALLINRTKHPFATMPSRHDKNSNPHLHRLSFGTYLKCLILQRLNMLLFLRPRYIL